MYNNIMMIQPDGIIRGDNIPVIKSSITGEVVAN